MSWTALRHRSIGSLGEGVERAEDRLTGKVCALKRAELDRRGAPAREHARLIEIDHPAFRALASAAIDPEPTLVLELVEGRSPEEYVAHHPHAARALAIELLRALLHLHERRFVYGDLKPDNLLIEAD